MSGAEMHLDVPGADSTATQPMTACAGCGALFAPTRSWQRFHSQACRAEFHQSHGCDGVIKASRRLKSVRAVVIHLPPEYDFVPGERVRLVKA